MGRVEELRDALVAEGITLVFGADEAISVEEAVRGYTINSAYINFDEDIKGSIEPGKLADMIVLSADILSVDAERIMDIEIEQTYVGGELVFSSN